eukprot:13489346-Alexandrium_andersonii.AAC.1
MRQLPRLGKGIQHGCRAAKLLAALATAVAAGLGTTDQVAVGPLAAGLLGGTCGLELGAEGVA